MSRASAEELDFPVLFPVLDLPNHSHGARVSWQFDPGQFSMSTKDGMKAGFEVCCSDQTRPHAVQALLAHTL